jgi:hypothetical protein
VREFLVQFWPQSLEDLKREIESSQGDGG